MGSTVFFSCSKIETRERPRERKSRSNRRPRRVRAGQSMKIFKPKTRLNDRRCNSHNPSTSTTGLCASVFLSRTRQWVLKS